MFYPANALKTVKWIVGARSLESSVLFSLKNPKESIDNIHVFEMSEDDVNKEVDEYWN